MRCLIIDHDAVNLDSLVAFFSDFDPVIVSYKNFYLDLVADVDFVVLSGGPIHISDPDDLLVEKEFLRSTNKPVFGICLGLEIFGVTFGVDLLSLGYKREGNIPFTLEGLSGSLFYSHSWFVEDVPTDFEVLVLSDNIIECIRHKSKPFFAVQGHPELSGDFGRQIRDYFLSTFVRS